MTTNLVVADASRTEKTICLAVSPSLKAYGMSGRSRLFEVVQKVREINALRKRKAAGGVFTGESIDDVELKSKPELSLDYIAATPRMALYIEYSTRIYQVYLKYVAPEDIHVYSIDEVFIDATSYLELNQMTVHDFAKMIILDVLDTTGITATAGIGTNLYLCKVAMDIMAKRVPADKDGVRIAQLDEMSYRRELWDHTPLTDFWRIGHGIAKKLEENGMFTMGDIALCSVGGPNDYRNEDLLYKLFGINAELHIDHAWGWEPCTMAEIKAYRPDNKSIGSGQVLPGAYSFEKARVVVQEMTDLLVLDLLEKGLVTNQLVLTIGYDRESLSNPEIARKYKGPVSTDHYGRKIPKHAHGTANLDRQTSSAMLITKAVLDIYDRVVGQNLLIKRIYVTANNVVDEGSVDAANSNEQLDLFTDYEEKQAKSEALEAALAKERKKQEAVIQVKKRFGKNAILKGLNYKDGATTKDRNEQIGGHKA